LNSGLSTDFSLQL